MHDVSQRFLLFSFIVLFSQLFSVASYIIHVFSFKIVGLRSGKVGEQCEAIVRFPQLFEKYPFPILINSSFVKIADVFRVGLV
jgi:hypothetical protein